MSNANPSSPETGSGAAHPRMLQMHAIAALVMATFLAGQSAVLGVLAIRLRSDPERLVDAVVSVVRSEYPPVRRKVVERVQARAPAIGEYVSREVVLESSPDFRRWLEQATEEQIPELFQLLTEASRERFRAFLEENRSTIEQALEELHEAPERFQATVLSLEESLESTLAIDLERQAQEALRVHRRLNDRLSGLAQGDYLTPRELMERRILRLTKTLADGRG